MTDEETPSMDEVRGWLQADALDVLHEWLRQTGPAEEDLWLRVRPWDDGSFHVEGAFGEDHGAFRVTVLVEPWEVWRAVTWAEVAELMSGPVAPVTLECRLAGTYGVIESAMLQRWHVDPRSSYWEPTALEHDVVAVKMTDRPMYRMPPEGQVEIKGPEGGVGPAVASLLAAFSMNPVEKP